MTIAKVAKEIADKAGVEIVEVSEDSESDNEEIVVARPEAARKSGDVNLDDEFEKIVPFKFKRLSEESIDEVDHEIEEILSDAEPLEIELKSARKEENFEENLRQFEQINLKDIVKTLGESFQVIDKKFEDNIEEADNIVEDCLKEAQKSVEKSLEEADKIVEKSLAEFEKEVTEILEDAEQKVESCLKEIDHKVEENLQETASPGEVEIHEIDKKVEDILKVTDKRIEEILEKAANCTRAESLEIDKTVEDILQEADKKIEEILKEKSLDGAAVKADKQAEILEQIIDKKADDNLISETPQADVAAPDDHKSSPADLEQKKRLATSDVTETIEVTPIISEAKTIIDENLLPRKASSRENSVDKPPVPIQTYLWEDLKRAKEQVSGDNVCTSICSVTCNFTRTRSTVSTNDTY